MSGVNSHQNAHSGHPSIGDHSQQLQRWETGGGLHGPGLASPVPAGPSTIGVKSYNTDSLLSSAAFSPATTDPSSLSPSVRRAELYPPDPRCASTSVGPLEQQRAPAQSLSELAAQLAEIQQSFDQYTPPPPAGRIVTSAHELAVEALAAAGGAAAVPGVGSTDSRWATQQDKLRRIEGLLQQSQAEANRYRDELASRDAEIEMAKHNFVQLANDAESAKAEQEQLQRKVVIAERELILSSQRHREEVEEAQSSAMQTEKRLAESAAEVAVLSRQNADLVAKASGLEHQLAGSDHERKGEIAKLNAKCTALTAQWHDMMAGRDRALKAKTAEVTALKRQLAERDSSAAEADRAKLELHTKLSAAEVLASTAADRLEAERSEAHRARDAAIREAVSVQSQLDTVTQALSTERVQRQSLEHDKVLLLAELDSKKETLSKQTKELAELKRMVDESAVYIERRQQHADLVKSQMAEIDRLRADARAYADEQALHAKMLQETKEARAKVEAAHAEELNAREAESRTTTDKLTKQLTESDARVAELEKKLANAQRAVDAAERRTTELEAERAADLKASADELAQCRAELNREERTRVGLAEQHLQEHGRLRQALNKLTDENAGLHERLMKTADEHMALAVQHSNLVAESNRQLGLSESTANERQAELSSAIQTLNAEHGRLKTENSELKGQLTRMSSEHQNTVHKLEQRVTELTRDVGSAREHAAQQSSLAIDLEEAARQSESRARMLEAGLNGLKQQADDVVRTGSIDARRSVGAGSNTGSPVRPSRVTASTIGSATFATSNLAGAAAASPFSFAQPPRAVSQLGSAAGGVTPANLLLSASDHASKSFEAVALMRSTTAGGKYEYAPEPPRHPPERTHDLRYDLQQPYIPQSAETGADSDWPVYRQRQAREALHQQLYSPSLQRFVDTLQEAGEVPESWAEASARHPTQTAQPTEARSQNQARTPEGSATNQLGSPSSASTGRVLSAAAAPLHRAAPADKGAIHSSTLERSQNVSRTFQDLVRTPEGSPQRPPR